MSTLTIGTLVWHIFSHEGKTAYQYNRHVIIHKDGTYALIYCGKTLLTNPSLGKLLEESSPVILDHYADQIVPVWDEAPSTYRYDGHSRHACEEYSKCPQHGDPGCDECGSSDHFDHCSKSWR